MAGVYLRKHPPTSPLMMFYGEAMPQFLRRFQPARSVPYLPDIAALELALRASYHAADATPINASALGMLSPDTLMGKRLRIAPATRTVTSEFPILSIYRANTRPDAPKPVMQAEAVLITRPQFDPELHQIDTGSLRCLAALNVGEPLGQAMAAAGEGHDLGAFLGKLLAQGAITEIY
jgi:hypothetical protein